MDEGLRASDSVAGAFADDVELLVDEYDADVELLWAEDVEQLERAGQT